METTMSRYDGKRLPKAKSSARQLLAVLAELLEEATQSQINPLPAKNTTQGWWAFDWVNVEEKRFLSSASG